MTKAPYFLLAAVPGIIAPVSAQQSQESLNVSEYMEAQIAIIQSATELLNIKSIASAPQEVAAGINQLTGIIYQLSSVKPQVNAGDKALMQTEYGQKAQTAATALHQALANTIKGKFYNSQELAESLQLFADALQTL